MWIVIVIAVIVVGVVAFLLLKKKKDDTTPIPPTPTCPKGQHYDTVLKKCVSDVVPVVKPTPPFPVCWWGPKPSQKDFLAAYCDGYPETQAWADWVKANPSDLDWAWAEFVKVNLPDNPNPNPNPGVKPSGNPPLFPTWLGPKPQTVDEYLQWVKSGYPDWYAWFQSNPQDIPNPFIG